MDSDDNSVASSCSSGSSSSDDSELVMSTDEGKATLWNIPTNCGDPSALKSCDESESTLQNSKHEPPQSMVHKVLRTVFGHDTFRPGQEWAIRRCLAHKRSLLVAPTGSGKSLCYTLPAAMMNGITIVVSPLLSLIEDQIRLLPPRLAAATLSGSMTSATTAAILDDISRGRIKLLFVSPERLASSSFRRLFRKRWNNKKGQYERVFPNVSLLCVDEAHCLSQWAHNFRPTYLRLATILNLIEPSSVLAITATAEPRVVNDICIRLQISSSEESDEDAVRVSKTNRDNIDVKCFFLNSQEERIAKVC